MNQKVHKPPSNDLDKLIGEAVQRLASERSIGKMELADLAKIHNGYFSELIHGKKRWNTDSLTRVAHALKISPAELLNPSSNKACK